MESVSSDPVQGEGGVRNQSQETLAQLNDEAEKANIRAKLIERCAVLLVSAVGFTLLGAFWGGLVQDQFANAATVLSPGQAK